MGIKRMWIAVDRSGRCRRFLPPHVVQGRFATARQSEPVIFLARKLGRSMYTGPTVVKLSKMKVPLANACVSLPQMIRFAASCSRAPL